MYYFESRISVNMFDGIVLEEYVKGKLKKQNSWRVKNVT